MEITGDQDNPNVGHPATESMDSLRQTNLQQEAALQAKSRLIDNMAYQIRTLSNAVIGFSDLLLCESLPPDHAEYITEINQAGKGLSDLVNEVLDWASLESGRLRVAKIPCSLRHLLAQLEQDIRPAAANKKLTFEVHADGSLPAEIVTDADRLAKCLKNLAANAIQHTNEGFVTINARMERRDGHTFVRFDVIDSGAGIPTDKLSRLFEPALAEQDIKEELITMLNLGMTVAAGLPLTRQLAELLGGCLEAQSIVGEGSTFSLMVPAKSAADNASQTNKTPSDADGNETCSPRDGAVLPILLVEDQESNRKVCRLILNTMGYEVDTAESGLQALERVKSRQYGLIFMDLKMPQMDGYEAARRLREIKSDVPIVAMSALSLNDQEQHTIADLFDAFLSKPIDSDQMLNVIRKYALVDAAALKTVKA